MVFPFVFRGIAKIGEPNNISPYNIEPAIHPTLRRKQRRLVRDNPGVLSAIVKGTNLAINECQHQFRNRRWNCSTRNFLKGKNLFGKIVDRGKLLFDLLLFAIRKKKHMLHIHQTGFPVIMIAYFQIFVIDYNVQ